MKEPYSDKISSFKKIIFIPFLNISSKILMLIVFENMEGGPRLVIEISAESPNLVSIIILGPSALIPVTCLGPYSSCNRHEDENDNF